MDIEAVSPEACANAICVYTDGACSGNPGPAGIGIVLRYRGKSKEISRYLGQATNNIAELEAIRIGLLAVKNRDLPVLLFTDSSYAIGLLTRGWKARLNTALVEEIRRLAGAFKQLRFIKVKGHAGHPDNERADRLAVQAIQARTTEAQKGQG
ncbi:MAG: ribonuclease HI [Desulfobacteraceae bacterium]|nr:MAG: ribonuclease HI [Desulfobacteraceae bacterium]